MVILTLLDSQKHPLRQWCFEHESTIRVGRAPDNHVVLGDLLVSRYHLELRRLDRVEAASAAQESPHWQLVNHSANGTFLDGSAVSVESLPQIALLQLAQGGPRLQVHLRVGTIVKPQPPQSVAPQLPNLAKQPGAPSKAEVNLSPRQPLLPCNHAGNLPNNLFCIHCGQPVHVEQTIRQYQVLRVLGKGGMGTTYLVWHATAASLPGSSSLAQPSGQTQGRLLVLKEMNADMARIPKAQELFEREANTLRALDHPGIPRFYDFFVEGGRKYLVMELMHGQDLERRIQQSGPVAPRQAIEWMIQTCHVLEYLHARPTPIIHRDIKPGNLLVHSLSHRIVVLDFGAVKAAGMPSGTRIGAEGYSAPEQAQGRPVPQSDLYAIGPSLVFLLTGENPRRFYSTHNDTYRLSPDSIPQIDLRLRKVIERATEPRPVDRYRSARELAQALAACL